MKQRAMDISEDDLDRSLSQRRRFILDIGSGRKEDEYRAYGYDFPPAGTP